MIQKINLKISFVLCIALSISSCGNQNQNKSGQHSVPKLKVIRVAYQLGHLPDIVAKSNHFFEEEFARDSIMIEYKKFDFGPPVAEAFVTKNVDIGTLGDQAAIIGWAKGADIQIVGNLTGGGDKMALLVPVNSSITSFSELKGKKIAVTIGANTQHLLNIFLKTAGFTQSDIHVVNLPFSECVNALSLHHVDATILSDPYISIAVLKNAGKVVRYSKELKYVTLPIISSGELIKNYPEILVRLLKVYYRANVWSVEHKEKAAQFLNDEENGLLSLETDLKLVDKYSHNYGLNDSAINAFTETYKYLRETNIIKKDIDLTSLYNTKFDIESRK